MCHACTPTPVRWCGWTLVLDGGTIYVFSYIQVPNLIKNKIERAKNKSRKAHECIGYLTLFIEVSIWVEFLIGASIIVCLNFMKRREAIIEWSICFHLYLMLLEIGGHCNSFCGPAQITQNLDFQNVDPIPLTPP
jgi:hypothetical protein